MIGYVDQERGGVGRVEPLWLDHVLDPVTILSLCSEHISMSVSKPGVEPGFPFQADLIRLWRILSKPPHILRVWGKRITELQESEQLSVHRQIKIEHPVI